MRKHQVDDLRVKFGKDALTALARAALGDLVHDRREARAPAVRHVAAMEADAVVEITDGVLAHRSMRMTLRREHQPVPARERPHRAQHSNRLPG